MKINITVRGVDDGIFRKFRAMGVENKMKLGDAITMAMSRALEKKFQ